MELRSWVLGLAVLGQAVLLTAPSAFAQEQPSRPVPVREEELSTARQAIQWSQDRLSEIDAAVAALEQDAAQRTGEARAKAEAALKELRDARDSYRAKAEESVANARTWTDAQVASARKSLDESWTAFQTQLDEYLHAVGANLATRQAVLEAEFDARRKAWQKSIDELRTEAGKLASKQRADIEARIDALNAQADKAKARIGRLQEASREAWATVKRSYAETQKLFADTYQSIRKSIEDATR